MRVSRRYIQLDEDVRENRWGQRIRPLTVMLVGLVFITLMGPAASEAKAPGPVTIKRDGVPVYADKTTRSRVIAVLERGTPVTFDFALRGPQDAWCHITDAGRRKSSGYVRCNDLDREPFSRGQPRLPWLQVGPEPREMQESKEAEEQKEERAAEPNGQGEIQITPDQEIQDFQQVVYRELIEIKQILLGIAQAIKAKKVESSESQPRGTLPVRVNRRPVIWSKP